MLICSGHCCCCWQPLDSIVQEKGSREKDKAWAVHRPNPLHAPSIQEAGPDPPGILQSRQRQNLDFSQELYTSSTPASLSVTQLLPNPPYPQTCVRGSTLIETAHPGHGGPMPGRAGSVLSYHACSRPLYPSVELNGLFSFVCEHSWPVEKIFCPGEETQQWAYLRSGSGQFYE